MTDPMTTPEPTPEPTPGRGGPDPLDLVPVALATVAAVLLFGGVLFALASADANQAGSADRFRQLGQAANPFIAFLGLAAAALVVEARRKGTRTWTAAGTALGIAAAVSLAVALLALNGILSDLSAGTSGLFRLSAIVSRLGTLGLSAMGLWLAALPRPSGPTQP